MDETAKYRLSVYQSQEVIKETPNCRIETVFCTIDDNIYIMRTYPEDKREVFAALAKNQSPRIPRIKEVIFHQNTTVIEEYIQGQPLREWMDMGCLTQKQAMTVARQLFEALGNLHDGKIIHQDIKPDNILMDSSANIWLIDFGVARLYDAAMRQDTQHFGTIGYAPPEQFGFSQSDFRSDIYAAGITLEEMSEAAGFPKNAKIRKVARKCGEFDPNRRYATAGAALKVLRGKKRLPFLYMAFLCVAIAIYYNWAFLTGIMTDDLTRIISPNPKGETGKAAKTLRQSENSTDSESAPDDVIDDENYLWQPIIDVYYDDAFPYLEIPNGTSGEYTFRIAETQEDVTFSVELLNNVLTLTLNDGKQPEQTFTFTHTYGQTPPDYEGAKVDAEITFFNMNEDGQLELLVALADRMLQEGVGDYIVCNTNWRAVWCIGYTAGEGFWQADGMMSTLSNHGTISVNMMESRELYDNYETVMVLDGRELKAIQ